MLSLFPGDMSTKGTPYATLADMRATVNALAQNGTHAVFGERYPLLATATTVPLYAADGGGGGSPSPLPEGWALEPLPAEQAIV